MYICKVINNEKTEIMTKELLTSTIKKQSTSMLKTTALNLMNDFSEGASVAFVFVLNELENRMSESEFFEFTESL
jgi:hypothetical protein